jgi:tRNA1Val (adenine37-N6)-methyltransferase
VGTGSGLISLMLAQRNPTAKITALDINKMAFELSSMNFENSPFQNQLEAKYHDFKQFKSDENFDLIVSNPPYFKENSSEKDKLARQTVELSFKDLISKASTLLSEHGLFSVIIPFEIGKNFIELSETNSLYLLRKIEIFGIENSKPKRLVLEFSKTKTSAIEETLIIEKSPRQYSDQYLELTKEFHVFSKI